MNEVSNKFLNKVSLLIEEAKKNVKTAVNIAMVYTYFEIGRMIIEEEQNGDNRAKSRFRQLYNATMSVNL